MLYSFASKVPLQLQEFYDKQLSFSDSHHRKPSDQILSVSLTQPNINTTTVDYTMSKLLQSMIFKITYRLVEYLTDHFSCCKKAVV